MRPKEGYWARAAQAEAKIHKILKPGGYALGGLYTLATVYDMEMLKLTETDIDIFLPIELVFKEKYKKQICSRFDSYGIQSYKRDKTGKIEMLKTIDVDGIKVDLGGRYGKDVKCQKVKSKNVLAPEEIVLGKLERAARGGDRASKDMRELRIIFDKYRTKLDVYYIREKAEDRLWGSAVYLQMMSILDKFIG